MVQVRGGSGLKAGGYGRKWMRVKGKAWWLAGHGEGKMVLWGVGRPTFLAEAQNSGRGPGCVCEGKRAGESSAATGVCALGP